MASPEEIEFHRRKIVAMPRCPFISHAVLGRITSGDPDEALAIIGIMREILLGKNIEYRQSRSLDNRLSEPDRLKIEFDLDHLHLGEKIEGQRFCVSTKNVLYGVFRNGYAYLTDIGTHGDLYSTRHVEIILKEWPWLYRDIDVALPEGAIVTEYPASNTQVRKARNKGIACYEIAGRLIVTGTNPNGYSDDANQWVNATNYLRVRQSLGCLTAENFLDELQKGLKIPRIKNVL